MHLMPKTMVAAQKIPVALIPKPVPMTYIGENKVLVMPEIMAAFKIRYALVVIDKALMPLELLEPMLRIIGKSGMKIQRI